jgi:CHASE2 domain-containing sensor protein
MTPHRILQLNGLFTAAGAAGMVATRGLLYPHFGLDTPLVLDLLAVGLFVYAGALVAAARRQAVDRPTLLAFTAADVLWVGGSAVVLLLFWSQFTPLARLLVIVVALAVEVFATLQYRAAGTVKTRTLGMA